MKRTEGHFVGQEELELYYQHWASEGPARATIVITHGMAEHSDAYCRLVAGIQTPGLEMYGWDLRGHGHSEGRWGIVREFDDYSKDLVQFVRVVSESRKHQGPLFLLGHSMGGLITLRALLNTPQQDWAIPVAGVILSSPLLGVALQVPVLKEKFGHFFANYFPNLTLSNEINFEDLSRDRAVVKEYEKDTLRHDRISLRHYVSLMETMKEVAEHADQLELPLLMMLAGSDRVTSMVAAQSFFEKYGGRDKKLIVYDGFYHEIFNDLGRERTYQDLKTWLSERI